jgi:deoxyribodipyrimidine photo-lyase
LNPKFANFPWKSTETFLRAWQKGETGYPIVDAGMRQLWQTGWMHNRVRMIVGSLLVKHLLQHWHQGARWFWDTLADADLANNTMGWQWIGGCGADAAPYFRIFNPMSQGEKFDKDGAYVKKYVPELANVPAKFIHQPWELGELELSGCGVVLGRDYPAPVIPHAEGRQQALAAFKRMNEER